MNFDETELGKVEISDPVIRDLAVHSYMEFNGLSFTDQKAKKEAKAAVDIEVEELESGKKQIKINVSTKVKYGESIPEYARNLQKKLKEDVENLSGLEVSEVYVKVLDVVEVTETKPTEVTEPEEEDEEEGK
ncbi:MAG: hypothetical protein DRP32_06630 [Thermotogae bacterium]|uniref:Asp23/Gls24 family envelope stress response protein n=1 Tax=Kosmotoga sp. TaxID=1955248 RepID=UPI000F1F52D7|nr:Asp23/Gls24 family envelope stress response protein [Kosmotoga sp.]MBO8166358.1 Asp23/Gls24 family envelope stress response protein [Kosmotoga sp.]MCD6159985.1 Asp23/Gls24 family envelope stress response protein [Kosmotoga sp.]RKX48708.1 MAG: hypothetical protein DRP32_06630 [Thermotogota bacterium]